MFFKAVLSASGPTETAANQSERGSAEEAASDSAAVLCSEHGGNRTNLLSSENICMQSEAIEREMGV